MDKQITGLNFRPDEQFEKMFIGLQNLVNQKYGSVFFLLLLRMRLAK